MSTALVNELAAETLLVKPKPCARDNINVQPRARFLMLRLVLRARMQAWTNRPSDHVVLAVKRS
jgi:hypothetical protein